MLLLNELSYPFGDQKISKPGPEVIFFFMLNSTEHKNSATKILTNEEVSCFRAIRCCIFHANKC